MFVIKKLLTPFLLPPGIFIPILIFTGLWFLYKRYRTSGITNILLGMFIWFLSISPVSDALFRGLEQNIKIPEDPKGDVIILLGGGVYDGVPDLSGIGAPSEGMQNRILTAARLQKKMGVPIIVSGGSVFGKTAEAVIGKRFLIDLGIPENQIILEDKSRDTIENAKYSKEICDKLGFKKPMLVTIAYHMPRSIMSFKRAGMDVVPFPSLFKTWDGKRYGWQDYLPGTFDGTHEALHEYLGLRFYRFAY
ncbi:MAG: YdcF family protein [Deltaproteobacteria bacterium]|nr:YdcF family protein [Deltaproteobacteria bacterium]